MNEIPNVNIQNPFLASEMSEKGEHGGWTIFPYTHTIYTFLTSEIGEKGEQSGVTNYEK